MDIGSLCKYPVIAREVRVGDVAKSPPLAIGRDASLHEAIGVAVNIGRKP